MGITAGIFRLDTQAIREEFGSNLRPANMHYQIVRDYNSTSRRAQFELQGEQVATGGGLITVYKKRVDQKKISPWVDFYRKIGIQIGSADSLNQHFACFLAIGDHLYAHAAGQGLVVFERFTDVSFPIEVARRIAKPEVKRARASQLSGTTLANDVSFRDLRRLAYSESLENVWTALSCQVRRDCLEDETIKRIFGTKRSIRLEVSSSVRLVSEIQSPQDLVQLISWLQSKADEELTIDDEWTILDSLRVLNPRKSKDQIRRLRTQLSRQIFVDNDFDDLDLINVEASLFSNATRYQAFLRSICLYDSATRPDLQAVVEGVKFHLDAKSLSDGERAALLEQISLESLDDEDDAILRTSGSLMSHIHGEMRQHSQTFFLLSGRWYQVDKDYIDLVTSDLKSCLNSLGTKASEIGMRPWRSSESEGVYNGSSLPGDNFINGDRVLRDNVELFDSLYWTKSSTYIIHVKRGFDVKIRDVRSQLINSANLIENDLRGAKTQRLARHWEALSKGGRTGLAKPDFLDLFSQNRVYVLAYATRQQVTHLNLETEFKSRVARMEVVNLEAQFRRVAGVGKRASLQIAWIPLIG